MQDFEAILTEWARRQLSYYGDDVTVESVEIYANPGDDRDDSYHESPSTDIVIIGWAKGLGVGRGRVRTTVTPDLLSIVREMTEIAREVGE